MGRILRESMDGWATLILAWATVVVGLAMVAFEPPSPRHAPYVLLLLPTAYNLVRLTLQAVRAGVRIDAERVEFDSLLKARRRTFPTTELLRYLPIEKHGWAVVAQGKGSYVPLSEPWDFHAAVVEFAPRALKSKRLRVRRLPPAEDLRGLWAFDFRRPPPEVVAFGLGFLALGAILHDAVGVVGATFLLGLLFALRMADRLDLTAEGLALRGPLRQRKIVWVEATAIFCEDPKGRRSFVVTAPGRGIQVPPHLARDLETMRKLIYSLPDEIRCVNFDETTFRGYRRKRKGLRTRAPRRAPLLPMPTT